MMNHPLVSVIIPAYNAQKTLTETIACVLAQTYANIELIIVDDASTDSTRIIAQTMLANRTDKPHRLIVNKENRGISFTRNSGIKASSGAFFLMLDADDLLHRRTIERLVSYSHRHPEVGGFFGRIIDIDIDSHFDQSAIAYRLQRECHFVDGNALIAENVFVCGSGVLIRRSLITDDFLYNESLRESNSEGCEDLIFNLSLCRITKFLQISDILVGYRSNQSNSVSSNVSMMLRGYDHYLYLVKRWYPDSGCFTRLKIHVVFLRWVHSNSMARGHGSQLGAIVRHTKGKFALLLAFHVSQRIYGFVRGLMVGGQHSDALCSKNLPRAQHFHRLSYLVTTDEDTLGSSPEHNGDILPSVTAT